MKRRLRDSTLDRGSGEGLLLPISIGSASSGSCFTIAGAVHGGTKRTGGLRAEREKGAEEVGAYIMPRRVVEE